MVGKLYGVGIGPGDPELLTVKAVRLLAAADVIAAPDTGGESQTALSIVAEYIHGKPLLSCPSPMTRDRAVLEAAWRESAQRICALLEEGKQVVFITLGDPSIYSTYTYVHRLVVEQGYPAEIVPGVPSFCAAAAKLGLPLCEGEERLLIVPASHGGLEESLDVKANKVLMKAGRQLGETQDCLRRRGELEQASLVVNCGLPGEQVWTQFADAPLDQKGSYFSLVILRDKE
jgi:precorrin-2/cobalt-factor-2 C20-methyltransferase